MLPFKRRWARAQSAISMITAANGCSSSGRQRSLSSGIVRVYTGLLTEPPSCSVGRLYWWDRSMDRSRLGLCGAPSSTVPSKRHHVVRCARTAAMPVQYSALTCAAAPTCSHRGRATRRSGFGDSVRHSRSSLPWLRGHARRSDHSLSLAVCASCCCCCCCTAAVRCIVYYRLRGCEASVIL